jgi:anti-sigma factor RsiW
MTCHDWQAEIDTYLDDELPREQAREFEAHLAACPACSSETLARSTLKRSIHLAGKSFSPDLELRKRIVADIQPKASRLRWGWIPVATAASMAVLAIALGALVWMRQAQSQQLVSEITDLHVTTLASTNRVDVLSSDKHTVKPWFAGKVPFTFNVPDLEGSPFELIGGKLTYVEQNPAAELLFGVRKHVISVFICKDTAEVQSRFNVANAQRLSFNIESWSDAGLRYVIVSDAGRADLDDLRARLVAAAH